jgi:protein CpxP
MGRSKYILLIIVLLTTLLALIVSGCCYHRTPEQRAERVVQHLVSTLKLDAAQTAKLETMKEEFLARRPDMVKMREESFKDVEEMMLSPQLNQARLNARTEKVEAHTNDLIRFLSAKFAELHDMLTPEQRTKLVAEMEKHAQQAHRW